MKCDNDSCNDQRMNKVDEDSRQEWYTATYECPLCGKILEHRKEYDQRGRTVFDKILFEEKEE